MNSLESYKKLSVEDNRNLEDYIIYRNIDITSKKNNKNLTKQELLDLRDIITDFYNNFSKTDINELSYFIVENYISEDITMEQLKKCNDFELYEALENDDITYITDKYNDNENER